MAEIEVEFTDRYGGHTPSLRWGCRGPCEATGWVPVYDARGDTDPRWREFHEASVLESEAETDATLLALWEAAEQERLSGDGWHFVRCPDCGGTGRTQGAWRLTKQFAWWLGSQFAFAWRHIFVWPYTDATARLASAWWTEHPLVETSVVRCPYRVAYGDRLDVKHAWWFNRKVALRVLFGRVR